MRRKKTELKKAKERLWRLCRIITLGRYGNVCYTSGKVIPKGIHVGHFIASSVCSAELRYSLDNLRPQSYHENINCSGNWIEYERRLKEEKGAGFVEALKKRNYATKGMKADILWYKKKIKEYENIARKEGYL